MRYLLRCLAAIVAFLMLPAAAAAGQLTTSPLWGPLAVFRVDVSRAPQIGAVVTVRGTSRTLTSRDFTVHVGRTSENPSVRRLSPDDLQVVISPDVHVPSSELAVERSAAAGFVIGLPAGAQTAIGSAGRPSSDPTLALGSDQALSRGPRQSAEVRLTAALGAFSSGASVRRTVVFALAADERLSAAAAQRLGLQMAASGTELYVLDASPGGAPSYDSLAAASGGFAVRVRAPSDWSIAFSRIATDLNSQHYVRFNDSLPLPGAVVISVGAAAPPAQAVVPLPAANPTAPPLPALQPLPPPPTGPLPGLPLALVALVAVGGVIAYGLGMAVASRREPRVRRKRKQSGALPAGGGGGDPEELFFVFLLPCLNEEKVILNSLARLLSLPGENFAVMVIDDGSDDGTAGVVSGLSDERVWLLRRTLPNARQGKGEALNAAIARLTESAWLQERDMQNVIVVVVDADGRVDPHSLSAVGPYFADPSVGAVQIGVRINNRGMSRLARMQDMEFVIYTEVFQRGRRHLGSVGLGGNGQFMRLSALRALGHAPWSRSLTEDLDLGIRLLTAGWRNEYCHTAAVHQQGVVDLRRLVRQRSRWFQGHLQSWKLIPTILKGAPPSARADLLYHLSSPAILLIASLLTASFICSLLGSGVIAARGGNPLGWWVVSTYALAFGPALIYSYTYWLREREHGVSLTKTAGLAHLYVCYCLMWYAAGWWAVGRTLRRRTNWSKTDRVTEAPLAAPAALLAGPRLSLAPGVTHPVPAGAQPVRETGAQAASHGLQADRRYGNTAALKAESVLAASAPAEPPSRPAEPMPGPPSRRRGHIRAPKWLRRFAVGACIGLAALGVALLSFDHGGHPRRSQWYQVFSGYGHTSVTGSGADQTVTLSVATTRSKQVTHAALLVSRTWYQDFAASAQVRTVRQLRGGSAGTPNPWEVGWVVWHYSSPQRFYALTLESNGWLLSKQDPAYPGGERFLDSGTFPRFPIGGSHRVGIVQIGDQITVSADGRVLTKFIDTQRPYLTGAFGVYAEDSVASFSAIHVQPLSGIAAYAPKQGAGRNR
jgi:1,2-diacylglycerol 3-beta-glucosyltransferase